MGGTSRGTAPALDVDRDSALSAGGVRRTERVSDTDLIVGLSLAFRHSSVPQGCRPAPGASTPRGMEQTIPCKGNLRYLLNLLSAL